MSLRLLRNLGWCAQVTQMWPTLSQYQQKPIQLLKPKAKTLSIFNLSAKDQQAKKPLVVFPWTDEWEFSSS